MNVKSSRTLAISGGSGLEWRLLELSLAVKRALKSGCDKGN